MDMETLVSPTQAHPLRTLCLPACATADAAHCFLARARAGFSSLVRLPRCIWIWIWTSFPRRLKVETTRFFQCSLLVLYLPPSFPFLSFPFLHRPSSPPCSMTRGSSAFPPHSTSTSRLAVEVEELELCYPVSVFI